MLSISRHAITVLTLLFLWGCRQDREVLTRIDGYLYRTADPIDSDFQLPESVEKYRKQVASVPKEALSDAPYGFEASRESWSGEVGIFVSDAVRLTANRIFEEHALPAVDLVLLDKTPIARGLDAGPVLSRDLWALYPDYTYLSTVVLDGRSLRLFIAYLIEIREWFAWSGGRVSVGRNSGFQVAVGGNPLNDAGDYRILMDQRTLDILQSSAGEGGWDTGEVIPTSLKVFELLGEYCMDNPELVSFDDGRIQIGQAN